MAELTSVNVRVVIENEKALRALLYVKNVLIEQADSQPWNQDIKKAIRAMRYAAKHVRSEVKHD